jgi:hypothetical protein
MFRGRRQGWTPRTPAAALKGVGEGLLPPETFILASASTKPLDEEPVDLEGVEREMARPERTMETSLLLRDIFASLARGSDTEAALFGAEGINALEARYLERIRVLKQRPSTPRIERMLARQYYELAALHQGERSVHAFYLRAAFACLVRAREPGRVHRLDLSLASDILLSLGLLEQAAQRLARVHNQDDPLVLLLGARVAFRRRDYTRVAALCKRLVEAHHVLTEDEQGAVAYWTGAGA